MFNHLKDINQWNTLTFFHTLWQIHKWAFYIRFIMSSKNSQRFMRFILLTLDMLHWNLAGLNNNMAEHWYGSKVHLFFSTGSVELTQLKVTFFVTVQPFLNSIYKSQSQKTHTYAQNHRRQRAQCRVVSLLLCICWQLIMRTSWSSWRKCSAAKLCPARTRRWSLYWMERKMESVCCKRRRWTAWVVSQHTDTTINPESTPNLLEHQHALCTSPV